MEWKKGESLKLKVLVLQDNLKKIIALVQLDKWTCVKGLFYSLVNEGTRQML